eukprot:5171349-Prymnesium_polylepis.1
MAAIQDGFCCQSSAASSAVPSMCKQPPSSRSDIGPVQDARSSPCQVSSIVRARRCGESSLHQSRGHLIVWSVLWLS